MLGRHVHVVHRLGQRRLVSAPPAATVRAYRCAVIGSPVAHSLSPVLHRAAYTALGLTDWAYDVLEVASADLAGVLGRLAAPTPPGEATWRGLSVTMPHKQTVLDHLDVVDPLAVAVGAVNTVVAQRSGTDAALTAGFNTDVAGIVGAIREVRTDAGRPAPPGDLTAVVLGSGATACSALAALAELGATRVTVAARRHAGPGRALTAAHRMGLDVEALTWRGAQDTGPTADLVHRLTGADLVVSTLPRGAADVLAGPLAAASARRRGRGTLLDVVYDPWPTPLASAWQESGGTVAPGWLMLLHQACPQVRLMTGQEPPEQAMRAALATALAER